MKTIQYYIWEIIPTNTPFIRKKCSKCNCQTYFYCSNKFRLNSQKKYMDVWLIYKCENCNITYNLTILSRINPNTVNHELFRRFNDNDESLAWQYAFDMEILRKNRVEADFSNIEYNIVKQNEPLFDMINISSDSIEFEIKTSYCLTLKLTYVVRTCLEISNSQLESMLSAGILSLQPIRTTLKHKVKNGLKVIVNCEKLERFLKETSKK